MPKANADGALMVRAVYEPAASSGDDDEAVPPRPLASFFPPSVAVGPGSTMVVLVRNCHFPRDAPSATPLFGATFSIDGDDVLAIAAAVARIEGGPYYSPRDIVARALADPASCGVVLSFVLVPQFDAKREPTGQLGAEFADVYSCVGAAQLALFLDG